MKFPAAVVARLQWGMPGGGEGFDLLAFLGTGLRASLPGLCYGGWLAATAGAEGAG